VAPGFIDIHIHGGFGTDVMDASYEEFDRLSGYLAAGGVTSFLATTYTAPQENMIEAVRNIRNVIERRSIGAKMLGIHLEGPYINIKRSGAQNQNYIRLPEICELEEISNEVGSYLKIVTLAPELKGALEAIEWMCERNIVAAAGHTEATYDQARAGFEAGLKHASHLFNAMKPLHHREPGIIGATLVNDEISVELIADGVHLHPVVLKLVKRMKSSESTVLVSDAISSAGLPDGEYKFGSEELKVDKGVSRLESGYLVGSTIRLSDAIRNMIRLTGIAPKEAIEMATFTPAKVLGVLEKKGRLIPGMDADITVLDHKLTVVLTIVEGRIVYKGENA
jgi:N-acetylglucosamine-6-phosphate deacetylase